MINEKICIIDDVTDRNELEGILNESFDGLYLWHARKVLYKARQVVAATYESKKIGLAILETFYDSIGYVYYIAVLKEFRNKGIGRLLLERSIRLFENRGIRTVFASVKRDNYASMKLFSGMGFLPTSFKELSNEYGLVRALDLYRRMLVVSGEVLLVLKIH